MTVHLTGGASPKNIFWQTAGATTLAADDSFSGIVLSGGGISTGVGTSVHGRLLAQAAIALGANSTVTQPSP